jgi:hypothetical protein
MELRMKDDGQSLAIREVASSLGPVRETGKHNTPWC